MHAFFYESKNREEEKVDFKVGQQLYEVPNGLVKPFSTINMMRGVRP